MGRRGVAPRGYCILPFAIARALHLLALSSPAGYSSTVTPTTSAGRFPALDGLRAIAVALVMVGQAGRWIPIGSLGVAIFFVLSGFLITGLLLQEAEGTGTIRLRRFYARRALRIMPAAFVFLAVAWLVLHGTP